jgi:hypothetical protein
MSDFAGKLLDPRDYADFTNRFGLTRTHQASGSPSTELFLSVSDFGIPIAQLGHPDRQFVERSSQLPCALASGRWMG